MEEVTFVLKKLIFVLLLLIASAAGWGFFQVKSTLDKPVLIEQQTFITVKTGTSFRRLLTQLSDDKIMALSPWLRWVGYLEPTLTDIKAGTYVIKPQATLQSVLTMITEGKEYQYAITLVDGERFSEWRELLQADPHLKHTSDGMTQTQISTAIGIDNDKVEGYFLPNTYHFTAGTSDISILKRAHVAMMKELDLAWQQRAKDSPLKTPYQALIMASIIEKETAVASERGLVASVFMNRLRANMPLQTDPTVIYGMGDKYHGNITKKDLRTPTAYNTYTMRGLPPTPIAMPSKASIMAAVDPDNKIGRASCRERVFRAV